MPVLTYPEAIVVGLVQGVSELFPISSLGHSVLIPALIGGQWARDLNMSASESPYLAFIVGLHVATAAAMILYFWRDWVRIIGGFLSSIRDRRVETPDQRLAWMIILATIPVGLAGLWLEHLFRVVFSEPILTAIFLTVNGFILFAGERMRRRAAARPGQILAEREVAQEREMATVAAGRQSSRHDSGQRGLRQQEAAAAVQADRRLARIGFSRAIGIGSLQILALLPGISRDGIVMVGGMFRGLSRRDAARFSFLLSAPVILAAGAIKIPDLTGPLGHGIHGQILVGSLLAFAGAYLAVRFLVRYLSDPAKTLTPFAVYCVLAGLGSLAYLTLR